MNHNSLLIDAKEDTPMVRLETKDGKNLILIQGVSMPENAFEFYTPLFESIFSFFKSFSNTTLEINLEYMNSMSNKQILKLIWNVYEKSPDLKVIWKYAKNDDLIKIKGEEIKSVFPTVNIVVEAY
jgi:hypothetical protein